MHLRLHKSFDPVVLFDGCATKWDALVLVTLKFLLNLSTYAKALLVMEFQDQGYKIRKIFA